MQSNSITLSQLNSNIRNATERAFPEPLWLVAEIMELNENKRSGHCYMDLIEKSGSTEDIIAKSRATIWAYRWRTIRPYFETSTGTSLSNGLKVMLLVDVSFHEIYGFSLNVRDIDPTFTMGDLAMQKKENLRKLKEAGVYDMNKELELPEVIQNLAVITSETAAGYGDFKDSLLNNPGGFAFNIHLFNAIVQGGGAESSIIQALEHIHEQESEFDAVILIRGGGSQADLECFNAFDLCMNLAQFPLPIITGIGHDRDESLSDLVAKRSLKTPTAVAEFLIDKAQFMEDKLLHIQNKLEQALRWILQEENNQIKEKIQKLNFQVQKYLNNENQTIRAYSNLVNNNTQKILRKENEIVNTSSTKLRYLWKNYSEHQQKDLLALREQLARAIKDQFRSKNEQITNLERNLELLKPEKVLSRGYAIAYQNGKALKSVKQLKSDELIDLQLEDGNIKTKTI